LPSSDILPKFIMKTGSRIESTERGISPRSSPKAASTFAFVSECTSECPVLGMLPPEAPTSWWMACSSGDYTCAISSVHWRMSLAQLGPSVASPSCPNASSSSYPNGSSSLCPKSSSLSLDSSSSKSHSLGGSREGTSDSFKVLPAVVGL